MSHNVLHSAVRSSTLKLPGLIPKASILLNQVLVALKYMNVDRNSTIDLGYVYSVAIDCYHMLQT